MPLLEREEDRFPSDLFDRVNSNEYTQARWFALYTLSRQEKLLMRKLRGMEVPFYGPTISRRYRSPAGRIRVAYEPLFSNYVFIHGDDTQYYAALTTNCVSRRLEVSDGPQLTFDLQSICRLIELGQPLSPEARLMKGDPVRVRSGVFAGFEGMVIRRKNEIRLLVAVDFMEQGVSVLLDDCQLEARG